MAMGARGKLRQPIQWPKVPLALAYVISGRVSAAPAPADAPLLPGSVSFALPRPPYDVSGPLADGCLEIRGEAQGSAKVLLRNGKVVFFSSSWLPDEPRWEELLGRLQPVAWYEHRALEAGGALWPDFPQGAATVRRSAAMAHDHGVLPTVKVELESRPHPKLRLQAQITLCAWTGQVREVRRQPDTVYACPLVPRVGEADAVAAAREAVQQQGSTAGAYEWVQTELGQRGGSLCWVVLLGRLRSAHVPGYARFIRGVSVDADTGRVLATEREVDFDGIFQSVGGVGPNGSWPPGPLAGGTGQVCLRRPPQCGTGRDRCVRVEPTSPPVPMVVWGSAVRGVARTGDMVLVLRLIPHVLQPRRTARSDALRTDWRSPGDRGRGRGHDAHRCGRKRLRGRWSRRRILCARSVDADSTCPPPSLLHRRSGAAGSGPAQPRKRRQDREHGHVTLWLSGCLHGVPTTRRT